MWVTARRSLEGGIKLSFAVKVDWLMVIIHWFSTLQSGKSRSPQANDHRSKAIVIYSQPENYIKHILKISNWNPKWSGIASGRGFMVMPVCYFHSGFLFLHGTSLKRAGDNFPLHGFVIILEGKFIWGRKCPGAKKQEPHHGQAKCVHWEKYHP